MIHILSEPWRKWRIVYPCLSPGSMWGQKTQGHLVQRENMWSLPQAAYYRASEDRWDMVLHLPLQEESGSPHSQAVQTDVCWACSLRVWLFFWDTQIINLLLTHIIIHLIFNVSIYCSQGQLHCTCFLACILIWPVTIQVRRLSKRSSSLMDTTTTEA